MSNPRASSERPSCSPLGTHLLCSSEEGWVYDTAVGNGTGAAMTHWSKSLAKLGACYEAQRWSNKQPDAATAWDACERADWLLWILGRADTSASWSEERKPLVRCALACAAEGLRYAKEGEAKEAAEACISVTQAWCEGGATREEVEEARAAAYAADAADAAYAAADAAYAAAAAAAASCPVPSRAAASAASAAYSAAARMRVLREMCDVVRSHYPNPPVLP